MYIHVPNVHLCILVGTLGPLSRDIYTTLHVHTCTKCTYVYIYRYAPHYVYIHVPNVQTCTCIDLLIKHLSVYIEL